MNTPQPVDFNRLKGVLGNAKAVMNKVDSGNYQTGNVDATSLVQDTSNFVNEGNMNTNAQSMGNPTRQPKNISNENIMNSRLPDAIKKSFSEKKIQTPGTSAAFSLDDMGDLLQEKPMPVPSVPKNSINEQSMMNNQPTYSFNETELRSIIKDVLIEYLATDYTKNLTEGVIKKTINTLIKEGKVKTK